MLLILVSRIRVKDVVRTRKKRYVKKILYKKILSFGRRTDDFENDDLVLTTFVRPTIAFLENTYFSNEIVHIYHILNRSVPIVFKNY